MSEDGNRSEMNAAFGSQGSPKSAPATDQITFHPI